MSSHCATNHHHFTASTKMLVLVALFLVLLGVGDAAKVRDPPDILTGDGGSVTVKVGARLVLICHGDEALHWSVEHIPVDDRFEYIYSHVENNATASRPFATSLILSNANSNDVGVFTCAYNASHDVEEMESTIYVYLDDEKNTLVKPPLPQLFINANVGQRVIIPCKPTHPSVSIEMTFEYQEIHLEKKNYDPQIGYIIDPVDSLSSGIYSCIGTRDSTQNTHTWFVQIAPAKPSQTLRIPSINATDDGVIHLGSDFTLDCFTEEETYVFYVINWTEPVSVINSGRASVALIPIASTKKAFKAQLTVTNAKKEDSGVYVCKVGTQHSYKSSSKIIRVYGKGDSFLNVTTDEPNIEERKGHDAKWVINISSYPTSIDFVWTDRTGVEIGRDPNDKYRIERQKNGVVILKIVNTSLKNFGPYKFTVRLKDFKDLYKTLDLNLTVLDRPEILSIRPKEPESFFEYDKNYTMSCYAKGFPLPSISWYFQETNFNNFDARLLNCTGEGMKLIKTLNTTKRDQMTSSTIYFRPKTHGVLLCSAVNNQGIGCQRRVVKVIDFPGEKEFSIIAPERFIDQDTVKLTCALAKVNRSNDIQWKKLRAQEFVEIGVDNSTVILSNMETPWSWQRSIMFPKINKSHAGKYICLIGGGGDNVQNETLTIDVMDMIPPKIHATNLNQTEVTLKEGEPSELRLYCHASGIPEPLIEWRKDGLPPSEWPEEIKYKITENGQVLIFSYIRAVASGKYTCTANNRNGTDSVYMDIEVEGNGIHPALIGFIVICVVVILVLMFCIVKKNHKKRVMERYLRELQEKEFENGAVENINPELGIEDQACLLPYDKKWEFPRDRLRLGMQLGSGAFGRVMKAEAVGIIPEEPVTTVAVKMVKANADESHIKALMSELKIMVHLGQHVNVVNLLGAVTTSLVKKKELLVIVEYCKYGSLLNYMHRHRHTFINQLDPIRGMIDSSIYSRLGSSRFSQQPEAPRLNYASLTFTDTGNSRTASNGYRTLEEINSQQGDTLTPGQQKPFDTFQLRPMDRQRNNSDYYPGESHIESMCTDMSYISNSPTVCTDGKRRSSGASSWAEEHYRGDYHHVDVRPIRSVDLLGWAFQVTRGMEYLASRKVLHGDLAARNVLLANNNVVKICDFGLAKEMYKDYKYKKKSEGVLLPVKWMAIESIYFGVFSTQSDVWSYGVVLWELFTLGKTPYPGMEADDRFYKMLSEGYRMEKPPLAPSSIYDLMTECWAHEPSVRPTFSALVDRIGDLMEEGHRQQYVDLNVPYDKMNRECFSGKEDYLSKMNGPEFISVSARPTPERQYENVPQNLDSGYLIPISPSQPPNNNSNHLSPPPTEYQNVTIHQQEPQGHILANNAGYVFMSRPSPEISKSYVKFDYDPEKIIPSQTPSPPLPPSQQSGTNNAARVMPGISNLSYVPNNMFFPIKTLEKSEEKEEEEEEGNGKIFLGNSSTDHHNNEQAKHPRRIRRHKNDSGLGSIDSSQFDSRNPVDPHRESNGSAEEYENSAKDYGCQHNVAYVSVGLPKSNGTTHNNIVMHNGNNGVIV